MKSQIRILNSRVFFPTLRGEFETSNGAVISWRPSYDMERGLSMAYQWSYVVEISAPTITPLFEERAEAELIKKMFRQASESLLGMEKEIKEAGRNALILVCIAQVNDSFSADAIRAAMSGKPQNYLSSFHGLVTPIRWAGNKLKINWLPALEMPLWRPEQFLKTTEFILNAAVGGDW